MHHFHVHSNYSCRDGISKIDDILKKCKEFNMDAVSITDHASIGGTLDFYDKCTASNIKPILGCEFYLRSEEKLTTNPQERMHLILLCKNLTGWKNLLKLVRQSYDDFYYNPLATWESLRKYSEGLICCTACFAGPLSMPLMYDRYDLVEKHLKDLQDIFGDDLYIELEPNGLSSQKKINIGLYNLCQERNLKYIVAVDSHYVEMAHAKAQETMLGINFYSRITDKPKHMEGAVEEKVEDKVEVAKAKKPRKKKGEKEESLIQTEEAPVIEKKPKEKTRFAFERYDFWFMSEEELFKMWNEHHTQVGFNMENGGEAPHNLVLIQAIEYGKELVSKVEKFNIYPDRNDLFMTYDVDSYKDEIFEKWMDKDKELKISDNKQKSLKLLRYLANKGFIEKGIHKYPNYQEYVDRVNIELLDMVEANIVDYMLIVWDVINFCNTNNVNVGIARGSAAGSLIAFLIGIHCVDPIKYKLMWERFYNAGRKGSMPDIDIDFSPTNRHRVIEYLTQKYGSDRVAQICNYTFYRPKNTFKAVCRFYNLPFGEVNDLIRNIKDLNSKDDEEEIEETEPTENQNGGDDIDDEEENKEDVSLDTLHQQMKNLLSRKKVQKYLDMCAYKERIIDDCMAIVGCIANKSVHASGVVITSKPLVELCPVIKKPAKDKGSMDAVEQMTEWDMKMLDRAGFLKLDILGLNTVDIIAEAIDSIKTNYGKFDYDWKKLSNDDPKVLKLFTTGETSGVFQFDYGKELQRLCLQFQPKSFEDICALTALGRPGAKNFLEQYMINRSKSEQEIELPDERLKPILRDTNYVLAYQEQQMAIAKDLCGFTLKEADNLRKIVAKKQVDKIVAMKEKFLSGYDKNTVNAKHENGEKIWNDYFSNCEYLFNKSHAVSYSVISYATAFFKAHYPIEFMTAVLNGNNNGKREDLVPYIYECMKMGLKINVPNYRTYKAVTSNNGHEIFLGVNTIKDISDTVANSLNTDDALRANLLHRIFKLPKLQHEAIILSGFIDGYNGLNRRTLLETCRYYHKLQEDWSQYDKNMIAYETKVDNAKQKNKITTAKMPSRPKEDRPSVGSYKIIQVDDFTIEEKIAHEKEYLGYSYSDPDFKYMPRILTQTIYNYRQKKTLKDGQEVYIYGKVDEIKTKKDKNDNEMASIKVLTTGSIWPMYLTTFSSVWEKLKVKPEESKRYIFKCKVSEYMSTKTKQLNKGFNMNDYKNPEEVWE